MMNGSSRGKIVWYNSSSTWQTSTTIVAHNFRRFDGHFVLRTLLDADESPDVVMNCYKILSLIWREKLRFIDSLSFVQASIAQFPKMFGLTLDEDQSLLAKGFFCHLFHTKTNGSQLCWSNATKGDV